MVTFMLSLDDWGVAHDSDSKGYIVAFATHKCYNKEHRGKDTSDSEANIAWLSDDKVTTCHYCSASVPDEIQALVIMLVAGA